MSILSSAVIFDIDGVLVDSTEAHYEAWCRAGEQQGVPYPRALFDQTFGMHNRQTIPLWLGHPVSDEEITRIADYKEQLYRDVARKTLQPIPGVISLVHSLIESGLALAVGSSGPRKNVDVALTALGLRGLLTTVSCGDDVKEGKPDPAIFLNAAQKLKIAPERCLVIEDAPPGIEAAHRAGMRVVGISTTRRPEELVAADLVIRTFAELSPIRIIQLIEAPLSA